MILSRNRVEKFFIEYTDRYDSSDEKISLKIKHTFKVAEICDEIADSLDMNENDKNIAWLLGMLHDVGRFEQVKHYGTFVDAKSIDHAALGADILFKDKLIYEFIPNYDEMLSSDKETLELAIRLHSGFKLPSDLSDRNRRFADLIRDADKLDILRVNVEASSDLIWGSTKEEMKYDEVTPEVYNSFLEEHAVLRSLRKNGVDNLIGYVSLCFELVFPKSRQIAAKQGYIWELISFESEVADTREKFEYIRKRMYEFLA